ncbi:MAG: hypothetical protein ABL916_14900 [Burkholderiaceae bacterium]
MHHLEPLSWDAGSTSATSTTRQQGPLTRGAPPRSAGCAREHLDHARSTLATHAIFRLIASFRRAVERCAPPTSLATITNAVLELARLEFTLVTREPWCSARLCADCNRCIGELEGLVAALSGNQPLPTFELVHAMDTLIALLVQAEGARCFTGHNLS